MGAHGLGQIVQNGLVCYLDAANTKSYSTGLTWSDLTKSNNSGTLTNGPTFSNINKGCIGFDGTNDYINCGTNVNTSFLDNFTFCTWVNINNTATGNGYIISKRLGSTFNSNYQLIYSITSDLIRFSFIVNGATASGGVATDIIYNKNKWYNIVSKIENNTMKIYVNGTFITSSPRPNGGTTGSNIPLRIGTSHDINNYYKGLISNVLIYNRPLTDNEILNNFNVIKGRYL